MASLTVTVNDNWATGRFSVDEDTIFGVCYNKHNDREYIQLWDKSSFVPKNKIDALKGYDGFTNIRHYGDRIVWYETCGVGGAGVIANKVSGAVIAYFPTTRYGWYADSEFVLLMNSSSHPDHPVDSDLYVRNIKDGSVLQKIPAQQSDKVSCPVVVRGDQIFCGYDNGLIKIWNKSDASLVCEIGQCSSSRVVNIVLDGNQVMAAREDGFVDIFDIATGNHKVSLQHGKSNHYYPIDLGMDDSVIITENDQCLKLWNKENHSLLGSYISGEYVLSRAHLILSTPEGKLLFIKKSDGTIEHSVDAHPGSGISSLIIDGERLISADSGETIKIWNLESGKLYHTLTGGKYPVVDGSRLIAGSSAGTINIWDFA